MRLIMAPWPVFVLAGAAIGLLTGLFGVGGSSVATPLLSLLGVPGLLAIASPLPATIPSAVAAAIPYAQRAEARPKAAVWTLLGAIPGAIVGALLSEIVGGRVLLVASGVLLVIIGQIVGRPISESARAAGTVRRQRRVLLVVTSAGIGLVSGLLANGGGFLLVPIYILIFGLSMRQAAGTSLLVVIVLSIPTLGTHWALGHIDWSVAVAFALGAVPAAALGGQLAHKVAGRRMRTLFGWFLTASGVAFIAYRLISSKP